MAKKETTRVLIVEDEESLNEAYRTILEESGFEVDVAFDGQEALEKARDFNPHVILLDLRMPRMGGIEFLEKFDLASEHQNTKVVVFSNLDTQKEIDQAYSLGAEKYILKAWASPTELVHLVRDIRRK